jgi:hypothetical protein
MLADLIEAMLQGMLLLGAFLFVLIKITLFVVKSTVLISLGLFVIYAIYLISNFVGSVL